MNEAARFARFLVEGATPEYRPDLGPCLLYVGADNGKGYGQFAYGGKANGYAHRFAWESEHGPIPEGLTIDHLCRVRNCVRLAHLEVVDGGTNTRRGVAARRTCRKGHPRTVDNTYVTPAGAKQCRTCRREQWRKQRERYCKHVGHASKYDQVRVQELVQQIASGVVSVRAAAEVLGCSPKYLDRRARDWRRRTGDVSNRGRLREETRTQVLALRWAGLSARSIGQLCGVATTSVANIEGRTEDATRHWPFRLN